MLVAKAREAMKFSFNGYEFSLKRKEKLLFADDVFALLPEDIKKRFEKAYSVLPPFYKGEDLNGKTVLVFAQAAIGDALCMTPALREIKRRYPNMKLWVSISGMARPVLEDLPYIDKLLPHPTPLKEVNKVDYIIKVVEMVKKPSFDLQNLVQYFLWKFYLDFAEKEVPDVVVNENIKKELEEVFAKIKEAANKKKILLFHYLSSSIHRTLPPKLLKEIEDLIWEEYAPVICSLPEEDITVEIALDVYQIRAANLSTFMKNIKYLIAAVSLSDAVITADTATVHIAAGLGKPTVLISGAIEPELRCSTYPNVIPVRPNYIGKTCKSPCGIHAIPQPCREALEKKQFYSPCLEAIPPKLIYQALKDAEIFTKINKNSENRIVKKITCPLCENNKFFEFLEVLNSNLLIKCNFCNLEFFIPAEDFSDKTFQEKNWISFQEERKELLYTILRFIKFFAKFFKEPKIGLVYQKDSKELEEFEKELKKHFTNAEKVKYQDFQNSQNCFDILIGLDVIESTQTPLKGLEVFYSKLNEPGILLVSTYSYASFYYQVNGIKKYIWWKPTYPPYSFIRWKPANLILALQKTGFSQVQLGSSPVLFSHLLSAITPRPVDIRDGERLIGVLSVPMVSQIVLDNLKFLCVNSNEMGNYLLGIATKGELQINWKKIISRIITFSAIDYMWGEEK